MKRVIEQTFILTISNILTRVTALLFFIILARSLSVSDYGIFRYLITLSGMYALFFAGFPSAIALFISKHRNEGKEILEYFTNSLFLTISVFVLLLIIIFSTNMNPLYLSFFLFAVMVDTLYIGFSQGLLNYVKLTGFKLTENFIQLAILIVSYVIFREVNFTFAVVFFCFSGLLSMIIFEVIKPEFRIIWKISKEKMKDIIKYAVPVTLGSIGWTVMFGINAIFIKYFYGTEFVGYYSVGETIVQVFAFLPAAISTIMLPKVAGLIHKERLPKYLKIAVLGSLLSSFFILVGLLIFKTQIIHFVFSDKYLPSLVVILPLALGQIFISTHQIYASAWQGLQKPGIPSITISIAAACNIVGSFFLTRAYGIIGTAISTAFSSFVAFVIISTLFHTKWKTLSKV